MEVNRKRIYNWLSDLDQYGVGLHGSVNRLAYSEEDNDVKQYLINEMKKLDMEITIDEVGNIMGCLRGLDSELPAIWVGSHTDSVRNGGRYDGIIGVLAGLEIVSVLIEHHVKLERDFYVNIYTCEESAVFGAGCIGSRALVNELDDSECSTLRDACGRSLNYYLENMVLWRKKNYQMMDISKPLYSIELHIEQSDSLEEKQKKIGLVDYICAPTNFLVTLVGEQAHAGGMSMSKRKDPLAAMAEISMALEQIVDIAKSEYHTGTIGYVEVFPNTVNVIPGKVKFSVDIRDCEKASKKEITKRVLEAVQVISKKRKVYAEVEMLSEDAPVVCDKDLIARLEELCKSNQIEYQHTISGAYHDSLFLSKIAPVAMIFVPSKNGVSHSPKEYTDLDDIVIGCNLLLQMILTT